MSRTVTTLVLSENERTVVLRLLRRSQCRGAVEYDPTQITGAIATFEAGDATRLTVQSAHALGDVLTWANSTLQVARWDKDERRMLQGVRARLARRDADPAPTGRFTVEEVATLW